MGQKRSIPALVGRQNSSSSLPQAPGIELFTGLSASGQSVAVSGTNTYNSEIFNAANLDNLGLQVIFTGTPTGTLTVNCSIDGINFDALTFSPPLSQPTGAPLQYLIDVNQLPFPYIQISYTNASGSGTLACYLSAKDLN